MPYQTKQNKKEAHLPRGAAERNGMQKIDLGNTSAHPQRPKIKEPFINISENSELYHVDLAIPGLGKDDLIISIRNSILMVSGRKVESKRNLNNYKWLEFDYTDFKKSFVLPDDAEIRTISAKCKDGLLKIIIPKSTPR